MCTTVIRNEQKIEEILAAHRKRRTSRRVSSVATARSLTTVMTMAATSRSMTRELNRMTSLLPEEIVTPTEIIQLLEEEENEPSN